MRLLAEEDIICQVLDNLRDNHEATAYGGVTTRESHIHVFGLYDCRRNEAMGGLEACTMLDVINAHIPKEDEGAKRSELRLWPNVVAAGT